MQSYSEASTSREENKRLIIQTDHKNKHHTPIPIGIINSVKLYALPPKQKGDLLSIVLLGGCSMWVGIELLVE